MSDRGWDFEAQVQDLALPLEADVFGPFDHAGEVAAGLDILSDTEVAGAFFDEGVLRGRQLFSRTLLSSRGRQQKG